MAVFSSMPDSKCENVGDAVRIGVGTSVGPLEKDGINEERPDGVMDGAAEVRAAIGPTEGTPEGSTDPTMLGDIDGRLEGKIDGCIDESGDGMVEGRPDGVMDGAAEV